MSMFGQIERVLGREVLSLMQVIGSAASDFDVDAYLIGGTVRDLFLEKKSIDLDFMLSGDATAFVRWLRVRWANYFPDLPSPGAPVVFKRYLTAKLKFKEPVFGVYGDLDFSTMRSESYPVSGGAPVVSPGDLQSDLRRRDFSINAMAISLNGAEPGTLCDLFLGKEDVHRRVLRVLHEQSLVDDPARLIRAVRFQVRFGLSFEPGTSGLFFSARDGEYLKRLPRLRLFDEFRKLLCEKQAREMLIKLEEYELLRQIDPRLDLTKLGSFEPPFEVGQETWMKLLSQLFPGLGPSEYSELLESFELDRRTITQLVEAM